MKQIIKKIWPDVAAVLFFVILSFSYFASPVSEGLVLSGNDNTAAVGAGKEIGDHYVKTGEVSRWTNSLFGGMPTYQIAPSYGSRSVLDSIRSIYGLGLPSVVMYVFILLLGFYIFMRAFKFKPLLAAVGAVLWAFSSYFFVIIGAGHIWKVLTLAFIPPTIAGMVLCYRGKYLWGGAVTGLFLALQILSNHLQMTYYFLFVMLLMMIAYFIQAFKTKTVAEFIKASCVLVVAAIIAMAANASNLYHTYTYSKESMRGKCELASVGQSKSSGLTKDYITQWSYGVGETWSLLVPNVKGGASVPLSSNEKAMEKANPQYQQIYNQVGQYWGEQPGTSGPVYVGAFVLFLFILGLFIVKGPMKWALLGATILSIILSWGHNCMGFTEFFIDHIPLYNKFRTVSSILVIAEFTIPTLAIMALATIVREPHILKEKAKWFYLSFGLTGGIALLFAIVPTMFFSSYVSTAEMQGLTKAFASQPQTAQDIISNLSQIRQGIFTADAWRSFFIVAIGFALLWLYRRKMLKAAPLVVLIGVLCLIDMYTLNRRYLNENNFEEPRVNLGAPQETATDQAILQDKSLDYRVLNLATNTFNENETSYFHKSIGGYNAAKLGRYQDVIEHCIVPEMQAFSQAAITAQGNMSKVRGDSLYPILNMLNTKYFIMPLQGGQTVPVANPWVDGNAWFVHNVTFVDGATAEMKALKGLNPRVKAIADASFKKELAGAPTSAVIDTTDKIKLTSYECNELQYDITSKNGGLAVFSEIYYPEWTAKLDGKSLPIGRVDYILRGIIVPAGHHKLVMEFRPASVKVTETISYIAIVILFFFFLASLFFMLHKRKLTEEITQSSDSVNKFSVKVSEEKSRNAVKKK